MINDEISNDDINTDIVKNLNFNNGNNKDNLNDMDNRIHKINDKLNSLIKNSNIKTDETKFNT